ncbi:2-dehydropantoate 2-reductase [Paraburkholderia dipogonis]|uniref:2-dehydropantoate 2-reductase n=1 Tax=Paraburkholderia dipogonis TaxID=1211383 RepID=A0A4Y8MGZ8_9BURK|nr:2-dehydropantoate 2-reductase [Paraburkholderia dipogonis]TFE36664.1 2-dehydropantoate 2-reductase [Paraburkholderia dipogonis]
MKICVVGAGAIGGFLGTRLAASGDEVSVIAIGETLDALRIHGWRLDTSDDRVTAPVRATDDPAQLGQQELVIIALKGQVLPSAAPRLAPLIGPGTIVLPAMNGVPWWFNATVPELADTSLESVDPGGHIAAAIPVGHVLGCVVHASCASPEPGLVRHVMGQGLIVGEALGGTSTRATAVARRLTRAGFDVTVSADIRQDIWYKLWGNLTMNPVSAITGATIDHLLDDPLVREFCSAAMREAAAIGARLRCTITQDPEDRHVVTGKLGAFRTSMLQDAETGRPLELDGIVGAVHEMGRRLEIPTPAIDALFGLTRLFGRERGLYPAASA